MADGSIYKHWWVVDGERGCLFMGGHVFGILRSCVMCGAFGGFPCECERDLTMRDVLDDGRPILDPTQAGIYTDEASDA